MFGAKRESDAMPDPSDHDLEKREIAFRRGFLHGAEALVACAGPRLSKAHAERLSRWLAAELRPWATARIEDSDPAPPLAPEL
jgi:hypothetical protein